MSKKNRTGEEINVEGMSEQADAAPNSYPIARVIPDKLNLRKAASKEAPVVYILRKGEELEVVEPGFDWTRVYYKKLAHYGYVMTNYIQEV